MSKTDGGELVRTNCDTVGLPHRCTPWRQLPLKNIEKVSPHLTRRPGNENLHHESASRR